MTRDGHNPDLKLASTSRSRTVPVGRTEPDRRCEAIEGNSERRAVRQVTVKGGDGPSLS